ncbi:hypothetical protein E1B28_005262 [Marasmius oreades]|uniref:Costars domain-containing protein n=1 Tax=Marasmius oreades TaxID=181124 RepID=A0A9P7V0D6_9AGAR|nr:uncharacterized protein E1B28_005262 [Marasmius oreades]KAG7097951.1 hypothetical protein E1B28_005262 [Marasmius oreades]
MVGGSKQCSSSVHRRRTREDGGAKRRCGDCYGHTHPPEKTSSHLTGPNTTLSTVEHQPNRGITVPFSVGNLALLFLWLCLNIFPSFCRSPNNPNNILPNIQRFNMVLNTEGEIQILKDKIKEFGIRNSDEKYSVAYGILYEKTANTFEALNGTLRAAKKQKKIAFDKELLMMPNDKEVQVVLLED